MIEKFNVQMRDFNTLKLSSVAESFYEIFDENELSDVFSNKINAEQDFRVLGAGSNVWLSSDSIPVVIKLNVEGTSIERKEETTSVAAKAGENWSQFVEFLVSEGIGGLEFLIDIPGTVGAAPIQNIGAYGVEVGEYITLVKVFDTNNMEYKYIPNENCMFGYRDSIFKKDKTLIVTEVFFEFRNDYIPNIKNSEIVQEISGNNVTIDLVLNAVRKIRKNKIPDPKILPNSGSFFKNPILKEEKLKQIKSEYDDVVFYKLNSGYKVSAAWIIEKSGWKGKIINGVGMSSMHSLILTNSSDNNLVKIDEYVKLLKQDVLRKFDVELEVEPACW
ncbi:TPA: UDP-N-acetylmuramate dehydrogenase [Vibrio vulnificus]